MNELLYLLLPFDWTFIRTPQPADIDSQISKSTSLVPVSLLT